jgi:hypothetical protein
MCDVLEESAPSISAKDPLGPLMPKTYTGTFGRVDVHGGENIEKLHTYQSPLRVPHVGGSMGRLDTGYNFYPNCVVRGVSESQTR